MKWAQVGQKIQERMKEKFLEPSDVQARGGPTAPMVNKYIAGTPIGKPDTQKRLCHALYWSDDSIRRLLADSDPVELEDPDPAVAVLEDRLTRVELRLDEVLRLLADAP